MFKPVIVSLLLFLAFNCSSQEIRVDHLLESKGLRLLSKTELNEEDLNKVLAFNFEEFRRPNTSLVIKVVDGPHLELFSSSKFKTGKEDSIIIVDDHDHDAKEEVGHVHIRPSEQKIRRIEVKVLNVLGVEQISETK